MENFILPYTLIDCQIHPFNKSFIFIACKGLHLLKINYNQDSSVDNLRLIPIEEL